jgi:hypothetical protein
MKLPNTLLWIGALLTASSAIRCGGETGEPSGAGSGGSVSPPTSDAGFERAGQGGDSGPEAGSTGGSAAEGGSGGSAAEGGTGGFAAEGGTGGIGGNWGGGGSAGRAGGGNFPFDAGSPSSRDGGSRDGGPHEHEGEGGLFKDGSAGCPESLPSSTDPCWFPYPTSCAYTGQLCTCHASWNEPAYWTCFSAPVTPDASTCPATAPHDREPCTLQGLSCAYGMRQLQCFCGGTRREGGAADGAEWNCW